MSWDTIDGPREERRLGSGMRRCEEGRRKDWVVMGSVDR